MCRASHGLMAVGIITVCFYTEPSFATPAPTSTPAALGPWGHFDGRVDTHRPHKGDPDYDSEWPDWQEILLNDFNYIDRNSRRWTAHKGDHIDGASIPKVFWSWLIGTPTTGPFFDASVIHDSYCYRKTKNITPGKEPEWSQIHRMFYEGMRCSSTGEFEAQTKYWAVRKWGPPHDRSLFQRLFGSPDDPTPKVPRRGPAAQFLSRFEGFLNDAEIAGFFAGMTQVTDKNQSDLTEFRVSPSAQLVAATKLATQINSFIAATNMMQESREPRVSATAGPSVRTQGEDYRSFSSFEMRYGREKEKAKPEDFIAGSTYIVASSPEEKEILETAIFIAQHGDKLSPDDLDRLATEGIPTAVPR